MKFAAKILCAATLALTCAFATPAWAAPSDDKQAEAEAAYAQLVEKQEFLDRTSNEYGEAIMAQEAAEAAVTEAQGRIDEASKRIADLQVRLSSRVEHMYRQGSYSLLDVFLGSSSLSDLINNWNYLVIMNQNDANLIQESKDLRAEIQEQKAVLVEQQETAAAKAEEAKSIMEEAQSVVNEVQAIYDSLSAEAAELLAQEIAVVEAERAAAEAAASAAAAAANSNSNSSDTSDNSDNTSSDTGSTSGSENTDDDDDNSSGYTDGEATDSGNAIVERAMSWLGNAEYVWGSVAPGKFDCSGFVSYCISGEYHRMGTTYTFIYWDEVSNPRPGDICVNWEHCGIYLGNGQMIHCTSSRNNVVITPVWDSMIFVRY